MATAMDPAVESKDIVFRRICTDRFMSAIVYSVALQYFLMTIFLLFVNFNILHPIIWIGSTIRLLLSFYTWFVAIPLVAAVIIHGIVLTKPCLLEERYHPTHFKRWYRNLLPRTISLASNGTVGCLTAWLYTRFLRDDYRLLYLPGEDQTMVLNERFLYLFVCGLFTGCYCFTKSQTNPIATEFRLVLLRKIVQFRNSFYIVLPESMRKSFAVSLMYLSFYFMFSLLCRYKIASLLGGVRVQEVSFIYNFYNIATDLRLLLYSWLQISLILSNMNLMHVLFRIFLIEPKEFSIEARAFQGPPVHEPMLADALAYKKIPLVQQLAAEDLFLMADAEKDQKLRRNQLYLLTNPGGHPKNWRKLYEVCIKLIRDFTQELDVSIDGLEVKPPPPMVMMGGTLRPTSSMDYDRFLRRQYNQNFGVRSLSTTSFNKSAESLMTPEPMSEKKGKVGIPAEFLHRLPGYAYLFEESKTAKSYYLLSVQTHFIVKLTQSLAAIACRSLHEDQYGVVQNDLPCVIHSLLELKKVVDKIGSKNIDVRKIERNYSALKGAVKRSLYRLSIAFEPYINDILLDSKDMEALRPFLALREI
uniref:Nucleoporin NDC1 n=1 Tax=Anopheles atroparvus TaxID=41427 RepID=A0AAG5CRC2_ANOAO